MRHLILLIILAWTQLSRAESLEWLGDLETAKERAKQENKFIMVYFTGSDWCPWCKKLSGEVFNQPEFADFARAKLVLVEVDFPRYQPIGHLQQQANVALKKSYHVSGYPTAVILNPDGHEIHRVGYVAGGPGAFISQLGAIARSAPIIQSPPQPSQPEPRRKPVTFVPIPPATSIHYGALALKSISGPQNRRMVLINNASMMTGETAKVKVEDHDVVVCCKEIRDDSVLVTCDGNPMELKLGKQ
jgi:protein disulfide-isomerase